MFDLLFIKSLIRIKLSPLVERYKVYQNILNNMARAKKSADQKRKEHKLRMQLKRIEKQKVDRVLEGKVSRRDQIKENVRKHRARSTVEQSAASRESARRGM